MAVIPLRPIVLIVPSTFSTWDIKTLLILADAQKIFQTVCAPFPRQGRHRAFILIWPAFWNTMAGSVGLSRVERARC
ncbi:hypothetical protein MCP1_20191 [Candidatus Terasakiella magnetica]|nr:hypothetical protein MCP1_20191 [Candidatus Terasakiella magnetica]